MLLKSIGTLSASFFLSLPTLRPPPSPNYVLSPLACSILSLIDRKGKEKHAGTDYMKVVWFEET